MPYRHSRGRDICRSKDFGKGFCDHQAAGYLIYIGLQSCFEEGFSLKPGADPPMLSHQAFRRSCFTVILSHKSGMSITAFLLQFVDLPLGRVAYWTFPVFVLFQVLV